MKRAAVYPLDVKNQERAGKPFDLKRLVFHSDQGATDLIAMLSISKAKEGVSPSGYQLLPSTMSCCDVATRYCNDSFS